MVSRDSIRAITVPPEVPIREAARVIQDHALKIVLVCDGDGVLLGTVTDGDIRRAVVDGVAVESTVDTIMNRHPKVLRKRTNLREIHDYMATVVIRHLPLVDERGRVVDLYLRDGPDDAVKRDNLVLLMAGGRGERLMPLTADTPKPLLKVGDKPVLEAQIEQFIRSGFRRFAIAIHYLGHMIEAHFGDGSDWGVEIEYVREPEPLGTAGALGRIDRPREPILVMNGDIIAEVDFGTMVDYFEQSDVLATVGVREYRYTVPFGCVSLDEDKVVGIEEKPTFRHLINTGIYVLGPEAVGYLPRPGRCDMPEVFNAMIADGRPTNTFHIAGQWIDIGYTDDLMWAREHYSVKHRDD